MNIEELRDLTDWITAWLQPSVIQSYQGLQKKLQQNTAQGGQKQPFEEERSALIDALEEVPLTALSQTQANVLEEFGVLELLGKRGVSHLRQILYENQLDIATAAEKVKENLQLLNETHQWASSLFPLIDDVCAAQTEGPGPDEALIHIRFSGGTELTDFSKAKDWSTVWNDISYNISRSRGYTVQDVRIIGASQGSVILDVIANLEISATIGALIYGSLRLTKEIQEIRLIGKQIQNVGLKNEKIKKELEDEVRQKKESGIEEVAGAVASDAGLDGKESSEQRAFLKSAAKRLYEFLDEGGEVDIVLTKDGGDDEDEEGIAGTRKALKEDLRKLRQLESEIKRLAHDDSSINEEDKESEDDADSD